MSLVHAQHIIVLRRKYLNVIMAYTGEQGVSLRYGAERFYAINHSGFYVAERICRV